MSFGTYGIEWWAMVLVLGALAWGVWRFARWLRFRLAVRATYRTLGLDAGYPWWRKPNEHELAEGERTLDGLADLFSREPVWAESIPGVDECATCGNADPTYRCGHDAWPWHETAFDTCWPHRADGSRRRATV